MIKLSSILILLILLVAAPSKAELTAEDYYNTGKSYADTGKFDLAISSLIKAIELKPDYAQAFNIMGTIYYEENKINFALDSFYRALDIDAEYVEVLYNLGIVFTKLKQYPAAVIYYEQAIGLSPNCGDCYNNLAFAHYMLGEFDKAEKNIENALQHGTKVDQNFVKAIKVKDEKNIGR